MIGFTDVTLAVADDIDMTVVVICFVSGTGEIVASVIVVAVLVENVGWVIVFVGANVVVVVFSVIVVLVSVIVVLVSAIVEVVG